MKVEVVQFDVSATFHQALLDEDSALRPVNDNIPLSVLLKMKSW